jgi:hypothetical protein
MAGLPLVFSLCSAGHNVHCGRVAGGVSRHGGDAPHSSFPHSNVEDVDNTVTRLMCTNDLH